MDKRPSLLRDLAHELRDALSPVKSATDLMRLREFDADISRTMVQRIERGLEAALAAIDAFVMAEVYDSDGAALPGAAVPLAELLQLTQRAVTPALRERCRFDQRGAQVAVRADADRSVQVLTAMLEHAAVATGGAVPIEVQACGEGTPPALRVIFAAELSGNEASWFADYRARGGGSRMALRTARRIMTLQGGDLVLERAAAPGQWQLVARFAPAGGAAAQRHAAPPARAASAAAPRTPAADDGVPAADERAGVHVVIVDDNADVRRAYREGLGILGYRVTEAADAQAALRATADAAPAIVLIDIHLPGMNGYQLAQALKARAGGDALRLVMLSGMTLDETTRRVSQGAGFDQCFDKAQGPKALHALLRNPT
jgi:two-component system, sensor histidine kinase